MVAIDDAKLGTHTVYDGGLVNVDGAVVHFAAWRSWDDVDGMATIVATRTVGICGIVIGQQDYPNLVGGVAHAVFIVGIFDVPANHRAAKK